MLPHTPPNDPRAAGGFAPRPPFFWALRMMARSCAPSTRRPCREDGARRRPVGGSTGVRLLSADAVMASIRVGGRFCGLLDGQSAIFFLNNAFFA